MPAGRRQRSLHSDLATTLAPGTRIVTSPSRRAQATASAIAEAAGIESVTLDDRWREADFGIAEGLTFDELARVEPDLARRLADGETDIDWPGGERAAELADRVAAAWRELVEARRRRGRGVARRSDPDRDRSRDGPRARGGGPARTGSRDPSAGDRPRLSREAALRRREGRLGQMAAAAAVFGPSPLASVTPVGPKPTTGIAAARTRIVATAVSRARPSGSGIVTAQPSAPSRQSMSKAM